MPIKRIDFLIVGTQKGGTSALNYFLGKHPNICTYSKKEAHYFEKSPLPSIGWYHSGFYANATTETRFTIIGESTPIYMFWNPCAKRIYEYNPDIKLIFVLRNPMERAKSGHYMEAAIGRDPEEDFGTAIRIECGRILEDPKIFSYLMRGLYYSQIKRMLRYFPMRQMLFLKTEELKYNHKETLQKVLEFLGASILVDIPQETIFSQTYNKTISKIDQEFMIEYFKDDINNLENLLDWDCSDWLEVK
jgi:hypothetical protein